MKGRKSAVIAFMMMIFAATLAVASTPELQVEKVELELVEDYPVSYRIAPTTEIEEFLESHDVSMNLEAHELGKEIGKLKNTVVENSVTEEKYKLGITLNALVNGALRTAAEGMTDPVFMDIGTYRWVVQFSE